MKIGIVGTGNMGRTLGLRWAELGHDVMFGSSEAEKAREVAAMAEGGAKSGTYDEAAAFGELVLYSLRDTLPSKGLPDVSVLDGKILVDLNNGPIPDWADYRAPEAPSLAERVQDDAPKARVVKAFNTMAQELYESSADALRAANASVFVAGDDADAKRAVSELAESMGFAPVDCGPLAASRMLEALADFTRYLIMGRELGPFATLAVNVLPAPPESRFGGRRDSKVE